ncbi:MAG TPA: DUF2490 domain-containing protein [Saprospiraceae bacterium]|nr:DUF2490 domain-containing protein [Saprospiraceae bacterium]
MIKSRTFLGLILLHFVIFVCTTVKVQSQNTGNWLAYFGNQPMGKRLTLWNEIQYRDYAIAGDFNQLLLRAGVGYNLTQNNNNILAGYAYIITDRVIGDKKDITYENRLWQQFFNRNVINRVILQHRYRTEQRFINDDFSFRFRYMMNVIVPLNQKSLIKSTWYTHVFNELFINLDSPRFDRNRAYAGLGYVVDPTKRIEVGYLAQTLENSSRNQIQIYFFNTFRLY